MVHEIRLTVHPADWEQVHAYYLENTYYPANFEWNGISVEDVAFRSRGFGSRSGIKPGLKIDFDRFEPGRQFFGLKSVVLDNMPDHSMMRERVCMLLFRKMGLPAPREAHARLIVNGVYAGLYAIVESIDESFLESRFGERDGFLYEYDWTEEYWFEHRGPQPSSYSPHPFKPQTHESHPDARAIADLIRVLHESPDSTFAQDISRYLDVGWFLSYLAVEAYASDYDGQLGDWGLNNFYIYRPANQPAFRFLPWDKDGAFSSFERPIRQNADRNVLVRRLLAVPEFREYYLIAIEQCIELAGEAGGWFEQEVQYEYEQIRLAASEDPVRLSYYAEFENAFFNLKRFASERAPFLRREILDIRFEFGDLGKTPETFPFTGKSSGVFPPSPNSIPAVERQSAHSRGRQGE
ncbi:MAG: CotH kinase family protein [Acidobacteria bacterium]|nr:CotH kinase family protein [Acidobacteriota bacterium]